MTKELSHKERIYAALAELASVKNGFDAGGTPALLRFVAQLGQDSDGPPLLKKIKETELYLQELKSVIGYASPELELDGAALPQMDGDETRSGTGGEDSLERMEASTETNEKDTPALNEAYQSVEDGKVVDFPNITAPAKSTQTKGKKNAGTRRQPSKAYDFAMFDTLTHGGMLGRPIGMKDLFKMGVAMDDLTKKGSHTAQLNRWKEEGLLHWRTASDITLTTAGEERRKDLRRYVTVDQLEEVKRAYEKALEISPLQI